jgi:hypothetical protein
MSVHGAVDDPASRSRVPLEYQGRIVIDTSKHEFYPADLVSDKPLEPEQMAPISPDKVRRYELSGDSFVVTYLDSSAKPTAVITWRRSSAP